MSWQVIREPGDEPLLCVFSTVAQNWVARGLTADEVVDLFTERARKQADAQREQAKRMTERVLSGDTSDAAITYDDALKLATWKLSDALTDDSDDHADIVPTRDATDAEEREESAGWE